jgi:hypothetical protein
MILISPGATDFAIHEEALAWTLPVSSKLLIDFLPLSEFA